MFYTVSSDDCQILEFSSACPDVQGQADFFGCSVYIVEGQHSGLTAKPNRGQVVKNVLSDFTKEEIEAALREMED